MKIAAIDIGTNSIHMIIVDLQSSLPYRVIDRENAMILLGQGSSRVGRLTSQAMCRSAEVLSQYRKLADSHGVEKILACATSAVREASNGGDFLVQVFEQTGIRVRLVPSIEEGRLVLLAVQQQVTFSGQRALGTETDFLLCESLKLGFIRLAEGFLAHDPPSRIGFALPFPPPRGPRSWPGRISSPAVRPWSSRRPDRARRWRPF